MNYRQITYVVYMFFIRLWFGLNQLIIGRKPVEILPVIKIKSEEELYVEKQTTIFLRTFTEREEGQDNSINYSSNIPGFFYNTKEYQAMLVDPNNIIEKTWKSRIMVENTPRGNIFMHYDAYKRGFSYYSDQTGIPYSILNACVMKYVIIYRCRDFYMDEFSLPNNEFSSLYKIQRQEERDEIQSKAEKRQQIMNNGVKIAKDYKKKLLLVNETVDPFAKLKNYRVGEGPNDKNPIKADMIQENKKDYEKNKVLYLGKVVNFMFIQKTPKKVVKFDKPSMLTGFDGTDVQREVFNYREYKKLSANNSV
jgi:hypothetical protein